MEVWPFVDKGVCNMIKVRGREGSVGASSGSFLVDHTWHLLALLPMVTRISYNCNSNSTHIVNHYPTPLPQAPRVQPSP